MTEEEMERLKRVYKEEKKRRKRINEILSYEELGELFELMGMPNDIETYREMFSTDPRAIFKQILTNEKLIILSGSSHIYYEEGTENEYGVKTYTNIENFKEVQVPKSHNARFRKENTIVYPIKMGLHPVFRDEAEQVRAEFLLEAFKNGEEQAKIKVAQMFSGR